MLLGRPCNFFRSKSHGKKGLAQVLVAVDGDKFVGNHAGMSSQALTVPIGRMTLPRASNTFIASTELCVPRQTVAHEDYIGISVSVRVQQPTDPQSDLKAVSNLPETCALRSVTCEANMQQPQSSESNTSGIISGFLQPLKNRSSRRKKQPPTIFKDLPVPGDSLERFKCFKHRIEPGLAKHLTAKSSENDMFWDIYMVGTSEQDAEPTSVFYSDRNVAKRIHAFFKQRHIQEIIKKSDTDFPTHYTLQPPRGLSDDANEVTIWARQFDNDFIKTSCGLPIVSTMGLSSARATIGGSVLIDGTLFGMTVDHMISRLESVRDNSLQSGSGSGTDSSFEDYAMSDPDTSRSESDRLESLAPIAFDLSEARKIASVDMSNLTCRKGYSYLDWALIQLPPDFYLPNVVEESKRTWSKAAASEQCIDIIGIDIENRQSVKEVIIMSGNRYKPAVLRPRSASLLMGPGTGFTNVFTLSPRKGYGKLYQSQCHSLLTIEATELQEGDSGSWVVDSGHGQVYGHLVAGMADGDGLVVPIQGAFADMKEVTKASSIKLPSAEDLRDFSARMTIGIPGTTSAQSASNAARSNIHSMNNLWLASRNFDPEVNRMVQPESHVSEKATSGTLLVPQEKDNSAFLRTPEDAAAIGVKQRKSTAKGTKLARSQQQGTWSTQSIFSG